MLWPLPGDVEAEEDPCTAGPRAGIGCVRVRPGPRDPGSAGCWARSPCAPLDGQPPSRFLRRPRSLGFLPT